MIHVNRDATNLGIFSEEEVRAGLRSGRSAPADMGWRQGMADWQPLWQFSEFGLSGAPPPRLDSPSVSLPAMEATSVAKTEALAHLVVGAQHCQPVCLRVCVPDTRRDLRSSCFVSHSQEYKSARARHGCRRSGDWIRQHNVVADLDHADPGSSDFKTWEHGLASPKACAFKRTSRRSRRNCNCTRV